MARRHGPGRTLKAYRRRPRGALVRCFVTTTVCPCKTQSSPSTSRLVPSAEVHAGHIGLTSLSKGRSKGRMGRKLQMAAGFVPSSHDARPVLPCNEKPRDKEIRSFIVLEKRSAWSAVNSTTEAARQLLDRSVCRTTLHGVYIHAHGGRHRCRPTVKKLLT